RTRQRRMVVPDPVLERLLFRFLDWRGESSKDAIRDLVRPVRDLRLAVIAWEQRHRPLVPVVRIAEGEVVVCGVDPGRNSILRIGKTYPGVIRLVELHALDATQRILGLDPPGRPAFFAEREARHPIRSGETIDEIARRVLE